MEECFKVSVILPLCLSEISRVSVRLTFRLAVYRQEFSLRAKLLEAYDQWCFCYWTLATITSPLTIGSVCLLWIGLSLSSVCIINFVYYWKSFLSQYMEVLCQSRLWKADNAYHTYLKLQRQLIQLNGLKLHLHQMKVSVSGFILSYDANMSILILYY